MSSVQGKKIGIVGGGPGGLTLARLLQLNDAQVTVYERDQSRSARVQGSALDLHEDSGLNDPPRSSSPNGRCRKAARD
jgi:flavin-dependent dehydrogenase